MKIASSFRTLKASHSIANGHEAHPGCPAPIFNNQLKLFNRVRAITTHGRHRDSDTSESKIHTSIALPAASLTPVLFRHQVSHLAGRDFGGCAATS
jgi:hypothetical protein